jgi:hypothetical protein
MTDMLKKQMQALESMMYSDDTATSTTEGLMGQDVSDSGPEDYVSSFVKYLRSKRDLDPAKAREEIPAVKARNTSITDEDIAKYEEEMSIFEQAKQSAMEARLQREASGITQSLTEEDVSVRAAVGDPEYGNKLDKDQTIMIDVTDTDEGKISNAEPLYELGENIRTTDIDVSKLDPVVRRGESAGKGLMSPSTEEAPETDSTSATVSEGSMSSRLDGKDGDMSVPTKYGTAVFEMSTDLKKTEGVDPHIGADWENVTLALGIVPTSGLKIDGMVVPSDRSKRGKWLKKNGYVNNQGKPTKKFSSANIDTSGAVKDGVKRSDYSSDTEWSAAVIDNFKKGAEEKVEGFNDLGTKEQKAIIDLAWNMGVGGLDYSGNKAFIGELKKAPEDRDVAVMLEAGKHVTEGGKVMRGLARRKALFVNENIDNPDLKIVKIKQTSRGNKTYHTYINALGQSLKTIELGKRHSGSPDGIIDVATGEEVEVTSPRPMLRPDGFEVASN